VRHLPGVLQRGDGGFGVDDAVFTLVSACGKRGPIEVRENGAPPDDLFPEAWTWEHGICKDCLVAWDRAEGAGALQVVWSLNGKTGWAAGGAVVWRELPHCHGCAEPHRYRSHHFLRAYALAAVVRERK